jgi:hypothetical protein
MRPLLLFVLSLAACSPMVGQGFDWSVRTHGGDEFAYYALERLSDDSLFLARPSGLSEFVLLDSIATMRRHRNSALLPATIIGGVGGGALGFTVKPIAKDQEQANVYSTVFGVVLGGVAGYLVGSLVQPDHVMEFGSMDREAKADLLNSVMK